MTASQHLAPLLIDAEREKFWPQIAARAPHFVKWQARMGRMFPGRSADHPGITAQTVNGA
jgi:hypothetical protein